MPSVPQVKLTIAKSVRLRRAEATCRSRRTLLGVAPAGASGTIAQHIALSEAFVITLDKQALREPRPQHAPIGWDPV